MDENLLDLGDLQHCRLCPHLCNVDRLAGEKGFCRSGATPRIFRYGPHFGEEPPITGEHGSGTVFFSHCTMACIYCQNHKWSSGAAGDDYSIEELTDIFKTLYDQKCHNWNLVSPTPWLPQVKKALKPLISAGIYLPIVYNTSGFEHIRTLTDYSDLMDVALIDLRYAKAQTAWQGSRVNGYIESARESIVYLWNRLGSLQCDDDGIAQRGIICRMLALPGKEEEVVDNLKWLKQTIGTDIAISVMAQYMPVHQALETPGWDRTIRPDDYQIITDAIESLGFENGWVQACEPDTASNMLGEDMTEGLGTVR